MALPITHIVLTEKIIDKFFKDKNKKDFFVGTSFPDIRYLGVIDRSKTHYSNLSINDLRSDESFLAGLKFHSILDETREKFILENNIYSLCPESKYITQSLKFLEDEIFYDHIKDWSVYIEYFNQVLECEKSYKIKQEYIIKWHKILQKYFQYKPDSNSITNFIIGMGFTEKIADEIKNNISIMKQKTDIISIINNLYEKFDQLIV